jgi:endonuclease/exonuclease/phosphatase (EEP) superfamily protein YafD
MQSLVLITTILYIFLTLSPLLPSDHWVYRIWEFPRVQISILLLINILLSVFVFSGLSMYLFALINLALLVYQLYWIFPYTRLGPKQVKNVDPTVDAPTIKIITSNVLMTNKSSHKLLQLIEHYQPDVLVTLETDDWWENALNSLHVDYPHRIAKPLDNLYGMHVYSKHKMSDIKVLDLIQKDIPSMHCVLHFNESTQIKCHFLHPAPPSPTENETATPRDKELLLIADLVSPKHEPVFVTGDLNDVAWSPTTRAFRKKSGLLDPRRGRGFFNTFHAHYIFARWPLDHIFHSDHFHLIELKRLTSIDSDHFPLYASFAVVK